jgi:phospholipase/carboxylesterase
VQAWQHRYRLIDGADPARAPLILLHGSGGNEQDMAPLAPKFSPGSMAIAVRGAVPWEDGYAFFRRFEDRSIDEQSVLAEAPALADFIEKAGARFGFQRRPVLVGFSNGAIMAAALLLLYPNLASAAVLIRPLSPFQQPMNTPIPGTPTLLIDASHDERRSPEDGHRLAEQLERAGAVVTRQTVQAGHLMTGEDHWLVREWLAQ